MGHYFVKAGDQPPNRGGDLDKSDDTSGTITVRSVTGELAPLSPSLLIAASLLRGRDKSAVEGRFQQKSKNPSSRGTHMAISDPSVARVLVYNVVVDWVGAAVNLPPHKVDVSRTFEGAPPAGYGFNEGRYLQMCDQITPKLSVAAGRALKLPGNWRVQHEQDAINAFIDAVALRLMAAAMTPLGIKAHAFAMTHSGVQP